MKKHTLSGLIVLFTLLLILFACRKSIEFYAEGKEAPKSMQIESAKIWRSQHMDRSTSRPQKQLRPYWNDAWMVRTNDGKDLIIVPAPEKKIQNKNFSLRRFYIFQTSGNNIVGGKIYEFLGENCKVEEHLGTLLQSLDRTIIPKFTGLISEYDINYRFINSFTYKDGKKTGHTARIETSQSSKSRRTANLSTTTYCPPVYPYSNGWPSSFCEGGIATYVVSYSYDADGCLSSVTYTFLFVTCPVLPGGSGSGDAEDDSGSGSDSGGNPPYGGGGGGGSTPTTRDIHNKIKEECMSKTVDHALKADKNLQNELSKIIQNFDATKTVQIDIFDANIYYRNQDGTPDLNRPKPGETNVMTIDENGVFRANIVLGIEYHTGTSKESLITTLVHEVVHAYLAHTSNELLQNNHNTIAEKYVTPMATYLQQHFNMPLKNAYALAWGGIPDATVFANAPDNFEFTMSNGQKITKAEVADISTDYKDQSNSPLFKGVPLCP